MAVLIPKVVHRIWFGPEPMRAELVEFGRAWGAHGYEVRLWTEDTLPPLRCQREFDDVAAKRFVNVGGGNPRTGVAVQQADIAAYELVWRYGGIVANTDIEPLRALDGLLDGVTAFAGREDGHAVCNALMGATPEHPFFDALLDELPKRYWPCRFEPMNQATGPGLLTEMAGRREDLTVFDREVFYPFSFTEMDREWDEYPSAFCRHHWGHRRA